MSGGNLFKLFMSAPLSSLTLRVWMKQVVAKSRAHEESGLVLCQTLVFGLAVGWSPAFRLSFSG
jgi:hypothetical protein